MSIRNSSTSGSAGNSPKKNTIPLDTYLRHIERARGAGNWFIFSRDYVTSGAMSKLQALFIQDLINLAAMKSTKKDADGFFLCTKEYLDSSLRWDADTQKDTLRALKKGPYTVRKKVDGIMTDVQKEGKGFLELKHVGVPPKRWIKLDLLAIEMAVDVGRSDSEND